MNAKPGSQEWKENFIKKHGDKKFFHEKVISNRFGWYGRDKQSRSEITLEEYMKSQEIAQKLLRSIR